MSLTLKGCEDMAQAITNSSGAYVTGNDDGAKHEKRHANEHDWKSFDSPEVENVITLTDNKLTDNTKDLAYQKAFEQGLRTEEEWQEYNAGKRKDRQENSYREHVGKSAGSLTNALEKMKKKGGQEKAKAYQQLSSIVKNDGLAVHGNLYYISDFTEYEKRKHDPAELSKYREFEIETFRRFHESAVYKKLHPDEIRAEIHTDEMGAIHLQTSEVLGRASKNGQYQITPVACKEEALKSLIPEKAFQDSIIIEQLMKDKTGEEREASGDHRVFSDADRQRVIDSFPKGSAGKVRKQLFDKDGALKKNNPYRSDLVKRTYRRVENRELEKVAKEVAKEMGVTWSRDWGVSDGKHRAKDGFVSYKQDQEELKKEKQKLINKEVELNEMEDDLNARESVLDDREQLVSEKEEYADNMGRIAENQTDIANSIIAGVEPMREELEKLPLETRHKKKVLSVVDKHTDPEKYKADQLKQTQKKRQQNEQQQKMKEIERQVKQQQQMNKGKSL